MFKKFLQQSSALLSQQQSSILSAAFVIMAMTFVAKFLGLVKLRLLVHYFGDGNTTAAFILASKLPEFFFDILISSVLSVSFIPVYTSFLAKDNVAHARKLASAIINLTLIAYTLIALICFIFANQVVGLLTLGSAPVTNEVASLTALLIRWMLLSQFFLIVGGYATAILQAHQRFLMPAIAMTLYNASIILGLLFLANHIGILAAVVGMLAGGFLQFLIQVPFLKTIQFQYATLFSMRYDGVVTIIKLAIPRMVGIMSSQLVDTINIILALQISTLAVVSLQYATSLSLVPVTLFGAAIGQAALPPLTLAWARDQKEYFLKLFFSSFNQILFFTLPVSAIFIVLRLPIVRLSFGDPKFTWDATVTTGRTLAILGIGVVAQSAIMLLARTFYAMHDTKTPLKISVVTLFLNVLFAALVVGQWHKPVWWLAGTFSLTTILNAAILLLIIVKRLGGNQLLQPLMETAKLICCAIIMTIVMYVPFRLMDLYVWEHLHYIGPFSLPANLRLFIVDTRYTFNLLLLMAFVLLLGGVTYLGLGIFLQVEEMTIITNSIKKLTKARSLLSQSAEVLEHEHVPTR